MPDHAALAVLDLTMHLFDIKETLGDDSDRESPLIGEALAGYYYFALSTQLAHTNASVALSCTDTGATLVTERQSAIVAGTAYDLLRAVGGRRSPARGGQLAGVGEGGRRRSENTSPSTAGPILDHVTPSPTVGDTATTRRGSCPIPSRLCVTLPRERCRDNQRPRAVPRGRFWS